ncbi:hypothetical protein T4C_9167, partial [Trichinella pseudospiralis]
MGCVYTAAIPSFQVGTKSHADSVVFSPRLRLRPRLRANKNLHMPSGYALGILLH